MRKRTMAILFGIGFGLSIVAIIFFIGGAAVMASAAESCNSYYSSCDTAASSSGGIALLALGYLLLLAGGVLELISWIAMLIKQAQRQQWAWFVCTLLFGGIPMLIWLIVESEVPNVQYAAIYQPQPGYPPAYPPNAPYSPTSYPPPGQPYQDPYRPQ